MIKKWNRSFTVIGVLIGLLALLSACVRTSAEISNENYSLYQSEDAWHLENRAEVQAVEIRLGNEYDSERIRVCEGFLSLIKSVEGGTLIALVPETGTIQADTVLLSVHTQKAPELIDYVTVSSQAYAKTVEKTNSTRAYPAGISIIDNLVEPGSEADILVHAKDVNGLTGFDLFLTYDPQVIEPDPFAHDFVELTGALNDYHFQILKAELMEPGKIWISAGTTEMVVDFPDDHIIRVNMRAKASAGFSRILILSNSLFIGNGGVLNLQTTDGVIWIQDALPCLLGDINLDRIVNIMDFLLFRNAYGTTSNDPDYEELADISPSEDAFSGLWAGIYDTKNPDGLINIMDFNVFRNNYGLMNPGVPNLVKIAGDDGLVSRNSNTFEWRWLGNTYESEFEYQKDEGPWMAISENQLTWAGYSDGDHVFRVRTLDSDVISWHFHYVSEAFFIEGFEGNDLTYDWDLFGSVHPFVQGEVVSAGNNALRFGDCSDGEVSGATLYLTVDEPMLISFYRKVSSEFDRQVFNMEPVEMPKGQEVPFQKGDHLKFYVDDVLCGYWSGDVDWGRVVRRIPAGTSSLKWVYEKDGYQEELLDTAWIDEILMVPESAHADHLIDLGALVPVSDGMYALLEKVIGTHSMPSLMNVAYENCVKDISELWVIDWTDPLKHDKLHIQDIQGIEYLENLKYLYLAYNDFVDGSDLAGLSDLAYVNAKGNGISDLEPFENLLNLRYLQLDLNDISDISPLNGLYQLEALYLANNSIRDIRATRFLSELSVLDLRRNLIGDIRYLENLLHLNELYLQDNHIYNIQSLVNNLGLGAGDVLRLDYNYLDQNIPSLDMDHIQALKNRGVLIEYVPSIVESGVFWMGDTLNYGYYRDEQPIHDVRLTNDFYMGKYEVTNAEFLDFLNDYENPVDSDGYLNGHMVLNANHYFSRFEYTGSRFRLKDDTFLTHPVVYVTWWGAMEYCNWLSRQHGFQPAYDPLGRFLAYHGDFAADISEVEGYRLATEAEWEYAARGAENDVNTVTDYIYAGSNNLTEVGWYQVQTTHQVGQKIPNEIKLYDMSGNVWEWCHDFYGYNYYVESELENPWGPLEGSQRVRRGGSYYIAETCRIHARSKNSPSFSGDDLGFRIVRTKRR